MVDFRYAKGRIEETVVFVTMEMDEFDKDYAHKGWKDYSQDGKLQKLMDRTVENILIALIEASGTILVEEGISGQSYADILREVAVFFQFTEVEQDEFAKLAAQRNRLALRYLNYRWEAIKAYKAAAPLIRRLLAAAIDRELKRNNRPIS